MLLRKTFVIITGLFIVACLGDLIMHFAYKSDTFTTKSIICNSTTTDYSAAYKYVGLIRGDLSNNFMHGLE